MTYDDVWATTAVPAHSFLRLYQQEVEERSSVAQMAEFRSHDHDARPVVNGAW